jgi:hypothetical protein
MYRERAEYRRQDREGVYPRQDDAVYQHGYPGVSPPQGKYASPYHGGIVDRTSVVTQREGSSPVRRPTTTTTRASPRGPCLSFLFPFLSSFHFHSL